MAVAAILILLATMAACVIIFQPWDEPQQPGIDFGFR
jgi:hypothetical protein